MAMLSDRFAKRKIHPLRGIKLMIGIAGINGTSKTFFLISNHAVNDEIRVNHELLSSLLRFDGLGGGKWLSTEIRTQEERIIEIGVSKADRDDAMR